MIVHTHTHSVRAANLAQEGGLSHRWRHPAPPSDGQRLAGNGLPWWALPWCWESLRSMHCGGQHLGGFLRHNRRSDAQVLPPLFFFGRVVKANTSWDILESWDNAWVAPVPRLTQTALGLNGSVEWWIWRWILTQCHHSFWYKSVGDSFKNSVSYR